MKYFIVVASLIFAAAAAQADGVSSAAASVWLEANNRPVFAQIGRATYYHKTLQGKRTANGERFNTQAMTAAHRRLKFNTYVRVTNLRNQRSVIVRINDRLPPRSRAIIDLTHKAARQLGMFHRGYTKVKLEIVDKSELAAATQSK